MKDIPRKTDDMRSLKFFVFACTLIFWLWAASCAKVGPAGANGLTGPTGPAYTNAVIMGHVSLYDQYGVKVLGGLNKVQIYLNYGNPVYPDTTGYYSFTGVATGNYLILAADSAFAVTGLTPFQCVLDTVYKDIRLSAIPTFSPASIAAFTGASAVSDSVVITFPSDPRTRACIVFLNNTSAVNNKVSGYVASYTCTFTGTTASFTIPAHDLCDYGFASGSKVYVAAYGYALHDYSVYEDLATGKNVYNAVSNNALIDSLITP